LDHKLYKSMRDEKGVIDHGKWLRAKAEGHFVGECRRCGDVLLPLTPRELNSQRTDYGAECRNREGCGWECVAVAGHCLIGSARKSERWSS
jgi:hypothetical protein